MAWLEEKRNGNWAVGWRQGGKKVRQTFHSHTEAKAYKATLEAQMVRGEHVSIEMRKTPLSVYVRGVLDNAHDLRESTRASYESMWRRYLKPLAYQLQDCSPAAMRGWFTELYGAEGVTAPVLAALKELLSRSFNQAVQEGYVHQNPMPHVPIPRRDE